MVEEASLEFKLRKIDETRNYFLDEIKHNDLMSEKYKKTCKYLNYVEHLLIKKKKKKHDKYVLLGKDKLNTIEVLISKAFCEIHYIKMVDISRKTYSYISHNKFVLLINVLREYNEMKKEIKILKLL